MFKWFRQIKEKSNQADELVAKAHQSNLATVEQAKARSSDTAKQADKEIKKVYDIARKLDVAEKIFIATGQHR